MHSHSPLAPRIKREYLGQEDGGAEPSISSGPGMLVANSRIHSAEEAEAVRDPRRFLLLSEDLSSFIMLVCD
jgi:hypothetical protein